MSIRFSVKLCKSNNFTRFEVHLGQFYTVQEVIHFKVIFTFVWSLQIDFIVPDLNPLFSWTTIWHNLPPVRFGKHSPC